MCHILTNALVQTETKVSKWQMPDELLLLLEQVEKDGKANAPSQSNNLSAPPPASAGLPAAPHMIAPAFTPQSNALVSLNSPLAQNMDGLNPNGTPSGLPLNAASILPARPNLPDEPTIPHNGFATVEEGEKAFTYLLRKAGVDENWTWDQTMRAIITDPLYKALNSLAEKKAAWQKVRPFHASYLRCWRSIWCNAIVVFLVCGQLESEGARGTRSPSGQDASRYP